MSGIKKVKSTLNYNIGTIVEDDNTGEVFEVMDTLRISVFDKLRYCLTLKLLKVGENA